MSGVSVEGFAAVDELSSTGGSPLVFPAVESFVCGGFVRAFFLDGPIK